MLFEKQEYQEECVGNIVKVLESTDNLRDLSNLKNGIKELHAEKNIPVTTIQDKPRLDVLMETGTGKTFAYLKTMYELNKRYGINKFVIFVPRLAIRAGVIQNIDLTSDYFFQEYGKRLEKYTYEGNLGPVNSYFRNEHELSVLILTSASIASRSRNGNASIRILTRATNENSLFPNLSPLEAINKLKPVVFIDEPHLLKGDSFVQAYREHFSDSLLIRFGATYPNEEESKLSNVVYVLDSITSLRSHLVKKIRVSSFSDSRFSLRLNKIVNSKEVEIAYPEENREQIVRVRVEEDIGAKTGNRDYAKLHITRIQKTAGRIYLSNQTYMDVSHCVFVNETIREMVRDTIRKHFEKERRFFPRGIKTLSLFFIPNIHDFRGDSPRIKKIFEEEYRAQRTEILADEIDAKYRNYLEQDFTDDGELRVHDGYFSGDNDSEEKVSENINKILKDKTTLLSTADPLRFIFSVWALQEGWDNPNVFNICKLSAASQDTSRRQQVGRGLRIAVDTNGIRQTLKTCEANDIGFYDVNMLDMIVSGQEGNFIKDIQDEIMSNSFTFGDNQITFDMITKSSSLNQNEARKLIDFLEEKKVVVFSEEADAWIIQNLSLYDFIRENKDSLPDILVPKYDEILKMFQDASSLVEDGNKGAEEIAIRQKYLSEFKELWETITRKAKIIYKDIREDGLIESVSKKFNKEEIPKVSIKRSEHTLHHEEGEWGEIEAKADKVLGMVDFFRDADSFSRFIFDFARKSRLPLPFVMRLFARLKRSNIENDPRTAERLLSRIINDEIHSSVVESVGYEFEGEVSIRSRNIFYDEDGNPKEKIKASLLGRYGSDEPPADHYLYDKIRFDSNIEKEASLKSEAAWKVDSGEVQVFAKLPQKLSIPTPYRHYNPDFAYYIRTASQKKIFFVVETKGYDSEDAIPADERDNVSYAKKFFQQLDKEVGDDIKVVFKQRINKQTLSELLQEIRWDS